MTQATLVSWLPHLNFALSNYWRAELVSFVIWQPLLHQYHLVVQLCLFKGIRDGDNTNGYQVHSNAAIGNIYYLSAYKGRITAIGEVFSSESPELSFLDQYLEETYDTAEYDFKYEQVIIS